MATADLSFDMRINGTPEEVASILAIMFEYNEGKNGAYFSCTSITIGNKRFSLSSGLSNKEEIMDAVKNNSGTVEISSLGPFGKYYEIDDVDILRDMAKAAPNAHFTATIDGNAGYADQNLSAELANGKMHVSTFYLSDDALGDATDEYYKKYLPYEKFIELFQLDGEEFDEGIYEDFICDGFDCYEDIGEYFAETEYEDFIDALNDYDVECPLSEEEYEELAQQFIAMDYEPIESYLENEGFAQRDEYTFDPADESNIGSGNGKIKMVPGVAYSINDNIREYLDSIGHPSDDETINNLSVEDVYSILAGTYGKDSSDGEEVCSHDDAEEITDDYVEENAEEIPEEEPVEEEAVAEDIAEEAVEETPAEEITAVGTAEAEFIEESIAEETVEEVVEETSAEESIAEEASEEEVPAEDAPVVKTAENENKSSAPKKAVRTWLIVLLVIILLICLAACALVFSETLRTFVMDLLDKAAQLL